MMFVDFLREAFTRNFPNRAGEDNNIVKGRDFRMVLTNFLNMNVLYDFNEVFTF